MHYHAEIIMPPTNDVDGDVAKFMADFDENKEDAGTTFWDWYRLGGRYSGAKAKALCDPDKLKAFYAELKETKTTVSGLLFGKQELSPPDQAAQVDAMWLRYFPDSPIRKAPMFKHAGENVLPLDICKVSEIPQRLSAHR